MKRDNVSAGIAAIFALLSLATVMWGQGARGRITGVVKDATNAVIPSVTVALTEQETGLSTAGVSQPNGVYLISGLAPGTYRISAEARGFKRLAIDGLKIEVGTTLTQDLSLQVGTVTETLEVRGQTSLVETTSGSVGTTVDMTHVLEIPVSDRNVFNLINLVPGAFHKRRFGPAANHLDQVSLGGARGHQTLALLDGVNNTRGGVGIQNIEMAPPVDAVQEFKVQVNNLSAEYGRSGGGVINTVTRSGTNRFHGSLYEFVRNDKFDAAGWGNDSKPKLNRNIFGGTVGGPIKKDRAFFFFNFDGLRNRMGSQQTRSVGLPEWRTGDFSTATRDAGGRAELVSIHDPETGTGTFGVPRATMTFPGNRIPASRLDPVAVKALGFMPLPNRRPDNPFNNTGNWQELPANPSIVDYYITRIDYELTSKTKLYGRYILVSPYRVNDGIPKSWPVGFNVGFDDFRKQNWALNTTHLFSPSFFLNFTAGAERLRILALGGNAWDGVNYPELLGLRGVPGPGTPAMLFGGGLVPLGGIQNIGIAGGPHRFNMVTNSDYVWDFTKVRGAHTFKFGGEYHRYNNNTMARTNPSGAWVFDGHFTRGVDTNGNFIANTGINLADYLLGRVTSVSISLIQPFGRRSQYYGTYFQDDWRVTSRLTINIGFRYDTQNPTYSADGRMSGFDPYQPNPHAGTSSIPVGALGVVTFANQFGQGKYLWNWDKAGYMPRFGFAYRIFGTNNTVIRGGFGLFFGPPIVGGSNNAGTLGFSQAYSADNPVPYRLRDGIPDGALVDPPSSEVGPTFGNRGTRFEQSAINFFDPYRANSYSQNINVTLQHQWKQILFEVGYLGNLSRHVSGSPRNINLIRPEMLSRTDLPEYLRRPFTIFASNQAAVNNSEDNVGISNYHALTIKSERRFSNGFSWTIAYSHSKWIDNINFLTSNGTTLGDNTGPQNFYNRSLERSRATNDIPHRLSFAPVVELPLGKGKRWLNHGGVSNAIFGGWQISTFGTLQSGSPFGVTVLNGGRDVLGDAAAVQRPNLVGDPNSSNHGQPAAGVRGIQWLNLSAFATPARFTFGTAARTLPGVTGPGIVQFDIMLAKSFRWAERWRVQFRWELLDAFNTPQFNLPATAFGGGNFGISSATDPASRRIMQLSLKLYW